MRTLSPTPPTGPTSEHPDATKVPDERFDPVRRWPAPPARPVDGNVVAYLLILIGVVFLVATVVPLGGGAFLLGPGLAFLVARFATGRYGYAVPAGILVGLGAFVALGEAAILPTGEDGWAMIFLGLGFLAIYPLGGRPRLYWPVFPGAVLLALGLARIEAIALAPLAAFAWVARYWPILLVVLGLWVLARDALPRGTHVAVGAILLAALILGSALALAAASVRMFTGTTGGDPLATFGETSTLTAPISAGQPLRIANLTGGSTRVIAGDAGQVQARITRPVGFGPPATVGLGPTNGGVTLEARSAGSWPNQSPSVSLVVEVPRDAAVTVEASSGDVVVDDRAAAVNVTASSGSVAVSRVAGPATVTASSGSVRLSDVTGNLDVVTSSGSVDGTALRHPRNVQTSSGSIRLDGTFDDVTQIHSSSGGIVLRLAPASSTHIHLTTSSGGISTGALALSGVSQSRRSLDGTLGSGVGTLTIETSSGGISLDALR